MQRFVFVYFERNLVEQIKEKLEKLNSLFGFGGSGSNFMDSKIPPLSDNVCPFCNRAGNQALIKGFLNPLVKRSFISAYVKVFQNIFNKTSDSCHNKGWFSGVILKSVKFFEKIINLFRKSFVCVRFFRFWDVLKHLSIEIEASLQRVNCLSDSLIFRLKETKVGNKCLVTLATGNGAVSFNDFSGKWLTSSKEYEEVEGFIKAVRTGAFKVNHNKKGGIRV